MEKTGKFVFFAIKDSVEAWRKAYLGIRLLRHPRSQPDIYTQSGRASCNTLRFARIWPPGRGSYIRRCLCIDGRRQNSLHGMSKSRSPVCWCSRQRHHKAYICTRCRRACRNLFPHIHRYSGTDYSNTRRSYIHGQSYNDNHLKWNVKINFPTTSLLAAI